MPSPKQLRTWIKQTENMKKERNNMIKIVAVMTVKAECVDTFKELAKELVGKSHASELCESADPVNLFTEVEF